MIRFHDDRFRVPPLDDHVLDQLLARGLPAPDLDADDGSWVYDEETHHARAVAFLRDACHVPLDEAAQDRVQALLATADGPAAARLGGPLIERLRPYQREGVEFAVAHRRVLIADAMGLGKTVQALAALEELGAFPAVVICPAAVKTGWEHEVHKWLDHRTVQVVRTGRDRLHDVDITVLNAELLPGLIDSLEEHRYASVVLDEAHYFKNPRTRRSKLALRLVDRIAVRIGLTGTPIPNRRDDLIQQLRLLGQLEPTLEIYRGVLPHWWSRASGPLSHEHARRAIDDLPRDVLHGRLGEVCMIRRTKRDVAEDLPTFSRMRRELDMDDTGAYRRAEKEFMTWVDALRARDEERLWGQQLFAGRKHLSRLRREAALAKVAAVVAWVDELAASGDQAVIFAYHKAVVAALADALRAPRRDGPGLKVAVVTGDTHPHDRRVLIDSFGRYDVLVATMDSLGHGVDGLQHHANHIAFIELDWTPTKHEQCEGRLHRIGQRQPVTAWYFTAANTIEGAMLSIIDEKWADVQGVVDGHRPDRFLSEIVAGLLTPGDAPASD